MKFFIKLLLRIMSGGSLLLLMILISLLLTFDPNQYKAEISRLVEDWTGRSLTINGDLRLSVFPWLGIDLTQVSFGNAKSFGASPFAIIDQAQLRVKLLPLLIQKIEIDTVSLTGLHLVLQRHKTGQTNWADLATLIGPSKQPATHKFIIAEFKLQGLTVTNASVVWEDQLTNSRYLFSQLNLTTSTITPTQPLTCQIQVTIATQKLPLQARLTLESVIHWNLTTHQYRLESLQMTAQLTGKNIPADFRKLTLSSQLAVDVNQQQLILSALRLQALSTVLSGEVRVEKWFTQPMMTGQLQLEKLKRSSLFPSVPWLQTPGWQTMNLSTKFEAKLTGLRLDDLRCQIDKHRVTISQLSVNWIDQILVADSILVQALGMTLTSQLKIQHWFNRPLALGKLSVTVPNLVDVMTQLNRLKLMTTTSWTVPKLLFLTTASSLDTQFDLNMEKAMLTLTQLQLQVAEHHLGTPKLLMDFTHSTLTLDQLLLEILGLQINAKLKVNQLLTQPLAQGEMRLELVDKLKWVTILKWVTALGLDKQLALLGITFSKVSLATQFQVSALEIILTKVLLHLDGLQLQEQQIIYRPPAQTLQFKSFVLRVLNLVMSGTVDFGQLLGVVNGRGNLTIAEFNPRDWLQQFGQSIPNLADQKALSKMQLSTQFQGSLSQLTLDQLSIQLDQSKLQGRFKLQNFKAPIMNFEGTVDEFNVDNYLPPSSTATNNSVNSVKTAPTNSINSLGVLLDYLHTLNLNGQLRIDKLRVGGVDIGKTNLKLTAPTAARSKN